MRSSKLFPLAKKASAEEARDKSGYTRIQWERFYVITKDEANDITQHHPTWTWPRIPADKKLEIIERINTLLRLEKIPEPEEDILAWRMSIAIRDSRNNITNKIARESGLQRASADQTGP
ncbi:hypothetical protein DM02DRAFT_565976 [Periconia macrospinosa]|uniref:Uncharacterized protein n=1 Tax=Periconia macrospinosa TaxID=97972 RepID=A0A2V1DL91_9PLEO|nr:hypothetical protein DM02DRAFT_565976 [Periconia macrospinosa]